MEIWNSEEFDLKFLFFQKGRGLLRGSQYIEMNLKGLECIEGLNDLVFWQWIS